MAKHNASLLPRQVFLTIWKSEANTTFATAHKLFAHVNQRELKWRKDDRWDNQTFWADPFFRVCGLKPNHEYAYKITIEPQPLPPRYSGQNVSTPKLKKFTPEL